VAFPPLVLDSVGGSVAQEVARMVARHRR